MLDHIDVLTSELKCGLRFFLQGTAQVGLADCEGSTDMVYHWLRVQMLSSAELPRHEQKNLSHRRHHNSQEDEHRPRATVNTGSVSELSVWLTQKVCVVSAVTSRGLCFKSQRQ